MNETLTYDAVIGTPVAHIQLGILTQDSAVQTIDILSNNLEPNAAKSRFGRRVTTLLQAYFDNPHIELSLPLSRAGTAFQQRVWASLRSIRPGATCNYGEIATRLASSPRAVGNACRANPVPIIVPCHRVVAQQSLGGYCGESSNKPGPKLSFKAWLLKHEQC